MKARLPAPHPGTAVGQLRPAERQHEDPVGARPLEQVLDEVEQAGVGPLDVLKHHHDRLALAEPLEEEPPRAVHVLRLARLPFLEAEQVRQAWLDPAALVGVRHLLGHRGAQLGERSLGVV